MTELHKYVPSADGGACSDAIYAEQGFAADQLSVERGVNCLKQLKNGFTPEERLDGIHFEIADFHAQMKFLQVHISTVYA